MTTPPNAPDHGCSCGRPDCQYDKAWGNPLRETPSAPDDKPNAPEVDVLKRMQSQAAQFRVDSGNFNEAGLTAQTAEDRRVVDAISGGLETAFSALIAKQDALVAERDALTAEVGALRETVGLFADDAQRWSEVERRFNDSKTSAASMVLEGLGLEPTPYRDFAETVDAARAEAGSLPLKYSPGNAVCIARTRTSHRP